MHPYIHSYWLHVGMYHSLMGSYMYVMSGGTAARHNKINMLVAQKGIMIFQNVYIIYVLWYWIVAKFTFNYYANVFIIQCSTYGR